MLVHVAAVKVASTESDEGKANAQVAGHTSLPAFNLLI